jgi:hypothetical protein
MLSIVHILITSKIQSEEYLLENLYLLRNCHINIEYEYCE